MLVTWITAHQVGTFIPDDVDFNVMHTFLEFYNTLLGFINFRLFTDSLVYPPKLDSDRDAGGAGMDAMVLKKADRGSRLMSGTRLKR